MSETDIVWIKEALRRIELQLETGADKCRERHSELDKILAALTVRTSIVGIIAGLVAGGAFWFLQMMMKLK